MIKSVNWYSDLSQSTGDLEDTKSLQTGAERQMGELNVRRTRFTTMQGSPVW